MLRFVAEVGVSTSISDTQLSRFEQSIRQTLEMSVARLSLVLEPVKLTIENVPDDWEVVVEKFLHPKVPEMGKITAILRKESFIERDDFREVPPADFTRLSPGKSVILMGAPFPVTCTDIRKDASGKLVEIICQLEDGSGPNKDKKFKGKDAPAIHWVNVKDAVPVDEVRFFEPLFKSDDPSKVEDFEADINPNSLTVYREALIEPAFFEVAKKLITEAKADADARTKTAAAFSESKVEAGAPAVVSQGVANEDVATHIPSTADDTPVATASQLVGMECIRFQGMRLAYFAVDKEAVLGCLSEGSDVAPGKRPGDKIILNKIVSLKEEKGKKATA
jgi:glutaminyl-tRNA synthetase